MINIEKMTRDEWLIYRDDKLNDWLDKGNVLKPNIHCQICDPEDGYTCLTCEIDQIEGCL